MGCHGLITVRAPGVVELKKEIGQGAYHRYPEANRQQDSDYPETPWKRNQGPHKQQGHAAPGPEEGPLEPLPEGGVGSVFKVGSSP